MRAGGRHLCMCLDTSFLLHSYVDHTESCCGFCNVLAHVQCLAPPAWQMITTITYKNLAADRPKSKAAVEPYQQRLAEGASATTSVHDTHSHTHHHTYE